MRKGHGVIVIDMHAGEKLKRNSGPHHHEFICKSVSLPSLILHLGFIFFQYFSRAHLGKNRL